MSRYTPYDTEIKACERVPFDSATCIADYLEGLECSDGSYSESTIKRAKKFVANCEAAFNENEDIRVRLAIENCDKIRKYGRKYADSVWFTTRRG